MVSFRHFEDIQAWQAGRQLTRAVYASSKVGAFARDYALRDQIRRAALSVTSNIAEGFERASRREFHQFLSIAKGSAGEVRSQLYVALDEGYITEDEFHVLFKRSVDVIQQISGLMRHIAATSTTPLKPPR